MNRSLPMLCFSVLAATSAAAQPLSPELWDAVDDISRNPWPVGADGSGGTAFINQQQALEAVVDDDGAWTLFTGASGEEATALILEGFAATAGHELGDDTISARGEGRTQTWVNTDRGIEHIIELLDPEIESDGVIIERLFVGGLAPRLEDEQTVLFIDEAGAERLRYAGLYVFDAWHRAQTSWFDVVDGNLEIHVEPDADAQWPLTIDPIATSAVVIPSPHPTVDERFGAAVATGQLTGDSRPELVVGMSFFTQNNTDITEGGFAVFSPDSNGALQFFAFRSIGTFSMPEGMCGASIAVGNVSGTSDNDIVVGCPGAFDDDGAIVVFEGNRPAAVVG